eukprot:401359_1
MIYDMLSIFVAIIILRLSSFTTAASDSPFEFHRYIGQAFLNENSESSGLAVAPDQSHLIGVTDSGDVFFLNLNNYTTGHCVVDVSGLIGKDLEAIAIDNDNWMDSNVPDVKYAYMVHEG